MGLEPMASTLARWRSTYWTTTAYGLRGGIWTHGLPVPGRTLYQTELHLDKFDSQAYRLWDLNFIYRPLSDEMDRRSYLRLAVNDGLIGTRGQIRTDTAMLLRHLPPAVGLLWHIWWSWRGSAPSSRSTKIRDFPAVVYVHLVDNPINGGL